MIWCIVYSCCLLRRVGLLRRDFGLFFIIKLDYGEKPHLNDHQAQHDDHFNVPIHQFFLEVSVIRFKFTCLDMASCCSGPVSSSVVFELLWARG